MKKEELLSEIEDNLPELSCQDFEKIWNKIFSEEKISDIDKNEKEDLSELLMEEINFFEKEKILKIHRFIESRV